MPSSIDVGPLETIVNVGWQSPVMVIRLFFLKESWQLDGYPMMTLEGFTFPGGSSFDAFLEQIRFSEGAPPPVVNPASAEMRQKFYMWNFPDNSRDFELDPGEPLDRPPEPPHTITSGDTQIFIMLSKSLQSEDDEDEDDWVFTFHAPGVVGFYGRGPEVTDWWLWSSLEGATTLEENQAVPFEHDGVIWPSVWNTEEQAQEIFDFHVGQFPEGTLFMEPRQVLGFPLVEYQIWALETAVYTDIKDIEFPESTFQPFPTQNLVPGSQQQENRGNTDFEPEVAPPVPAAVVTVRVNKSTRAVTLTVS